MKLLKSDDSDFVLSLPGRRGLETFLEDMQRVPEYVSEQQRQALEDGVLAEAEEELVVEQPEPPVMDPETPAFRRAALVKQDAEKRFDFMSNRPVPRTSPVEPIAQPAETVKQFVVAEARDKPVVVEAKVDSKPSSSPSKRADPETLKASTLATKQSGTNSKPSERSTVAEPEAKWRDVPLTDLDMKFAVSHAQYLLLFRD